MKRVKVTFKQLIESLGAPFLQSSSRSSSDELWIITIGMRKSELYS